MHLSRGQGVNPADLRKMAIMKSRNCAAQTYHGTTMIYHGTMWYTTVVLPQYTMMYHGTSMLYHGTTMVHHDIQLVLWYDYGKAWYLQNSLFYHGTLNWYRCISIVNNHHHSLGYCYLQCDGHDRQMCATTFCDL